LTHTLQLRNHPRIFLAGQLTGTEGYLESSATGLVAGINASRLLADLPALRFPVETMLGALLAAITDETREKFQPMNSNMGVLPPLVPQMKRDKPARNAAYAGRAREALREWAGANLG
jgi:methylenetetrahydrofolate--tRNA-(uracil-5-)-methyltransferase